jgi:hypothetical protein
MRIAVPKMALPSTTLVACRSQRNFVLVSHRFYLDAQFPRLYRLTMGMQNRHMIPGRA